MDTMSTIPPKVESVGDSGSGSMLLVLVIVVIPEKLSGKKGVTKK